MTTPAITGTISHGTLRPEDLIPAFHSALIALGGSLPESAWESMDHFDNDVVPEGFEELNHDFLLEELESAIDALLPEGWRFGTHEGDGALFGIWEEDID